MDVVYFITLVSSLIFVHELGHFLFAKAFGVKVLTFSLGFGPKILKLHGRETEYCVSILPLGGYVKMLEESKSDIVLPEDRRRTFESLSLYKRVIIVLAGPVMNLVFPILLYFSVFVSDGPFLPPTIGVVLPDHPAEGKLLPGDRIMSVGGEEIGTFDELKRIVGKNPGKPLRFKVFRENKYVEIEITVGDTIQRRELDIVERLGTVGIQPSPPAPVIGVTNSESPAYRAGLRTFDFITHVGGAPVRRYMDLETTLGENAGETLPITYLRPTVLHDALGGLAEVAVFEPGVVALTPDASGSTPLERTGIELADVYVAIVPEHSVFYKAEMRPGDKILRLDGEPIPAWSTFCERLLVEPDKPHRIEFQAARDGRTRSGTIQLRREEFTDEHGQSFERYVLPLQHWVPVAPEERVSHPAPIRYAFDKAVGETLDMTRLVLVSIVRLIQGRVSLSSLSGPITIYQVAGQEGRKGTDYFLWAMALISINLGLFNLLPIPALDGGHLMFFVIEAVTRKPLPLRARELAHIIGMAILIGLMLLAFKNDVERRWEGWIGQTHDSG